MPTTIYDCSLITKRRGDKATSGSFINRSNGMNGTVQLSPSYGSLLGIYDQSILNAVKCGRMTTYTESPGGITTVDSGCPQ
jgi:hypothetical protein